MSDRLSRVLILGATGMLGHEAARVLAESFTVVSAARDTEKARRHGVVGELIEFDALSNPTDRLLSEVGPDAVVNAIGLVKQLPEGQSAISAIRLNALFSHELAEACRTQNARLVHVSTDCVFSGRLPAPRLYTEADLPDPTDVYGRSKLLGEVTDGSALTLRTSIIGWELERASGLLEWLASQEGKEVHGFRRAAFSGVTTHELARIVGMVLSDHPELSGLWHVASEPIDKYALLLCLREALDLDVEVVPRDEPVINRALDATRFAKATGYRPASWEALALQYAKLPRV